MKEIRYNVVSVSINHWGKKIRLRTRIRGSEDRKKMRIYRLCLLCAGSHHGFSQKAAKKDHFFFVGPLPPPSWFDVVL